jgi:hypothetical protein
VGKRQTAWFQLAVKWNPESSQIALASIESPHSKLRGVCRLPAGRADVVRWALAKRKTATSEEIARELVAAARALGRTTKSPATR